MQSPRLSELLLPDDADASADLFNRIFTILDARLSVVEGVTLDFSQKSTVLVSVALERIASQLTPIITAAKNLVSLGFLTAQSATPLTLHLGDVVTFAFANADQGQLFQPSPFIGITRSANYTDTAVARVLGVDRVNGGVTVQIVAVFGNVTAGPISDWSLSAMAGSVLAELQMNTDTAAKAAIVAAAVADAQQADTDARAALALAAQAATTAQAAATAAAASAAAAAANDPTNRVLRAGDQMAGALDFAAHVLIPSAASINIGTAASNNIEVSGTAVITDLGSTYKSGALRFVRFSDAVTLIYDSAKIILPGASNIVATAGDCAVFRSTGSGWRCLNYSRADGGLVGAPTAPTPSAGANSNQVATAAFVKGAVPTTGQIVGLSGYGDGF